MNLDNQNVFVLVTDVHSYSKAERTIKDLRVRGNCKDDIFLIPIQFEDMCQTFAYSFNIQFKTFPNILEKHIFLKVIADSIDNREKNQWESEMLDEFDNFFNKWQRLILLAPDVNGNYTQFPNQDKVFFERT
jgi:hypothetical protein